MSDLPDLTSDCDGKPLSSDRHLWSQNVLLRFDHVEENEDGEEIVGTMNGPIKHCEKCCALRFFPETEVHP